MADLDFTAAQVRPLIPAEVRKYEAADASITPGMAVYIKSDGKVAVTDANAAVTVEGKGIVVAVQGGASTSAAGDILSVVVHGPVCGFDDLTPGTIGYVSETAGDLADAAPTGAGTWTKVLGWAESADVFFVAPEDEAAASNSD